MQFYLNNLIEIIPTTKLSETAGELDADGSGIDGFGSKHGRFETIPTMASDLALFSPVMDNDVEDSPALG